MNAIKYISVALASMALAACSSENDLGMTDWQTDPLAVKVNATVNGSSFTRSNPVGGNATTFNTGDCIKITANDQYWATYQYSGAEWIPQNGRYLRWISTSLNFNAVYPTQASTDDFTVPADQSTLERIQQADWMTGTTTMYSQGPVNIEMQRQLARVIVTIKEFRSEIPADQQKVTALTITNRVMSSEIAVTPYASGTETIGSVGTTYTALVNPTPECSGMTFIRLTVNGKQFTVEGYPLLEAGTSYEFPLTIGKDKLIIGNVTVKDWTSGTVIEGGHMSHN